MLKPGVRLWSFEPPCDKEETPFWESWAGHKQPLFGTEDSSRWEAGSCPSPELTPVCYPHSVLEFFRFFPHSRGVGSRKILSLALLCLPCRMFSSPAGSSPPLCLCWENTSLQELKKPPWGQTSESSQPCPWQGISIYWNICELKPTPPFRFPFLKGCPGFAGDDKYRCICKNTV